MIEWYFIVVVVVLFALAVSDLIVGVGNDAVNFLNSAIGSKAGSFWFILSIAAAGIFIGVTFSSGMMEIARKGIFHPDMFFFDEIMIIFLAVMMTDILLLDFFNTFGLPTSTTVSIVFELLGASVAVSLIKISHASESWTELSTYINGNSALLIILGIFSSVLIAFTAGGVVQYIIRMFFSFNIEKTHRYLGAVWGGVAITAITYFILIKGASGSAILTDEAIGWIRLNASWLLLFSFLGWTVLLQLLNWFFQFNILRFIVLAGTFALALAFASNDLVNFIGVPLAGYSSFNIFTGSGAADPSGFAMTSLKGPVETSRIFLLVAGGIMVTTLFLSKKARSVVATTINLSRQDEGHERFSSNLLARSIVRGSIYVSRLGEKLIPDSISKHIKHRFDTEYFRKKESEQGISFDLLRASVNLIVASALIALGTSMKLPLSTTYVTFMVAMGTSLADGAWGRDSAVYRISGVITVIGGWFFTALSAFTVAFLMALIINWGGMVAIAVLILLAIALVIKTHGIHKKRGEEEKHAGETILAGSDGVVNGDNILSACNKNVYKTLTEALELYRSGIEHFIEFRRKGLKKDMKNLQKIDKKTLQYKDNLHRTILRLKEDDIDTGMYYVQVLDYLRESICSLVFIIRPMMNYINNNHPPLIWEQENELSDLKTRADVFFNEVLEVLRHERFKELEELIENQQALFNMITGINKKQLVRIRHKEVGSKNGVIYLNILSETRNLLRYIVELIKAQREFMLFNEGK